MGVEPKLTMALLDDGDHVTVRCFGRLACRCGRVVDAIDFSDNGRTLICAQCHRDLFTVRDS
jgi:hypothetical protein